ncbi:heparinase II/III family protein [Kordiimonas aquimaris]|uniref:heparinase II/III family protein n=1 Tax=Kordiimonas aquimaris TaxID=707591 RepID=UPI0021D1EF20|nr:heparinase II/III family protein [Kordiimonas aquimaris]
MAAAIDKIASFVSVAPLSRSTLRRDNRRRYVSRFIRLSLKKLREWGYGTSLYELRLKGRLPLQLLGSPDDPAPGNATLGSAILGGDMLYDGEQHPLNETFWADLSNATPAFKQYAHSFHWLQDLAHVADQAKARSTAESITAWWLNSCNIWHPEVWETETLARRYINWAAHAPLILSSDDLVYRSKVLYAMARQLRHLARSAGDAPVGLPQIYSASALTLGGLLLPNSEAWRVKGERALEKHIKAFVLPDGGPASRNTSDAIRTMQMLILVRSTYIDVNADLPPWVQVTLDRLAPFVRAMRHGDGTFAHIGGVSAEGGHGTDAILAASEAKGKAIENALHTGVQRVVANTTTLIVDTGTPPAPHLSFKTAAATSAFELSSGQERIIVNMGPATARGPLADLATMARTTAANSTLIIADKNSNKIMSDGTLGAGVSEIQTTRETLENSVSIKTIHNGYEKRFGVLHERTLKLKNDGRRLNGHDRLSGRKLKKLEGQVVTLRFHLHAGVSALKAPDGRITLETRGGKTWIFDVEGLTAEIDDSLYLSQPDNPQASKQIIISSTADGKRPLVINWTLTEIGI